MRDPAAPTTLPDPDADADADMDVGAEYAAAEALMRAGATTEARRALLEMVAAHPHDPRAHVALLDLARLAFAA